jgi:hypothetical protein
VSGRGIMDNSGNRSVISALALMLSLYLLIAGCAGGTQTRTQTGGQTLAGEVTTEYLLTSAGFRKWDVNRETPKRQALLAALPPGKISTYMRDGQTYHVYADVASNTLYIGDEAAYQRYLSLAGKRQLCERVTGANQVQFWSCMEEDQQRGGGQPKN